MVNLFLLNTVHFIIFVSYIIFILLIGRVKKKKSTHIISVLKLLFFYSSLLIYGWLIFIINLIYY